jgi:hypothetical protein
MKGAWSAGRIALTEYDVPLHGIVEQKAFPIRRPTG